MAVTVRDVQDWWGRVETFFAEGMWVAELRPRTWTARGIAVLQFGVMVGEGFVRDRLLLRASALTYFALLSLVPLLAIALVIGDAFGVRENLAEWVVGKITAAVPEARADVLSWVERARDVSFRGLGTLGGATLLVTTVLGIGAVEGSLNAIWGVTHDRSLARRFADYLAVLVVSPLLLGSALSLSGTLQSQFLVQRLLEYPLFATLYDVGLRQLPWVLLSLGFGFIYWFMPNTRVNPLAALIGGVTAAALTILGIQAYHGFGVGAARANALYAGYAYLVLFIVWIYYQWAIILLGAEVAFAYQNLELYRREVRGERAGAAEREAVGLRIAVEVARAFRDARPPLTADELSDLLRVPVRVVRGVLDELQRAHVVAALDPSEKENAWLLGRPAETIQVVDVLDALRGVRDPLAGDPQTITAVAKLLEEIDEAAVKGAGGRTLADVLEELPQSSPETPSAERQALP